MSRFAVFVLAALVLAPAGLAAPRTDADGRLVRGSSDRAAALQLLARGQRSAWRPSAIAGAATQQKALETALIRGINSIRSNHGLKPLAFSARLSAAAAQHTREMGAKGYFEHESYDSTEFWKRIERWYPSRAGSRRPSTTATASTGTSARCASRTPSSHTTRARSNPGCPSRACVERRPSPVCSS